MLTTIVLPNGLFCFNSRPVSAKVSNGTPQMTASPTRKACRMTSTVSSGRFAAALDLSREDPRTVARYTPPLRDGTAAMLRQQRLQGVTQQHVRKAKAPIGQLDGAELGIVRLAGGCTRGHMQASHRRR